MKRMIHQQGQWRCARRDDRGFTMVEVLVALILLTVGLLGLAGGLGVLSGGVASNIPRGLGLVTRGYYVSTATMLAQQRLEEVKQLRYQIGPPAVDQFGADPTPTNFADEAMGGIPGNCGSPPCYPNFSRQVQVQTGVPAANLKTVTVTVNFRLPTDSGSNQEAVKVGTLIAATP